MRDHNFYLHLAAFDVVDSSLAAFVAFAYRHAVVL